MSIVFAMIKAILIVLSFLLSDCASTTREGVVGADRKQFMMLSSGEVDAMSAQEYSKMKAEAQRKGVLDQNQQLLTRLRQIANRLTPHTKVFRDDAPRWAWEVHLITSKELNAFCMPGGKIMFYTGIVETLNLTDGEIAAIMGHEIAHALREHGRERISEQMATQYGVAIAGELLGVDQKYRGLGNLAMQAVVGLPHSRRQETEADEMGVELMARAGFNPAEAVSLWKKMGSQGGGKPPEILSTHPSDSTRIRHIDSLLPKVMPLYQQAAK